MQQEHAVAWRPPFLWCQALLVQETLNWILDTQEFY
jgi:hypothetical protein